MFNPFRRKTNSNRLRESDPEEVTRKLVALGYNETDVKIALLRNNNDYGLALDTLKNETEDFSHGRLRDHTVSQLVSLGVDPDEAFVALEETNLDVKAAVGRLSSMGSAEMFGSMKSISQRSFKSRFSTTKSDRPDLATDEEIIEYLVGKGYEKGAAAQAVKETEDVDQALVNLETFALKSLLTNGISKEDAEDVLKLTAGDLNFALDVIHVKLYTKKSHDYNDAMKIKQLQTQGYRKSECIVALRASGGDLSVAVFYLDHFHLIKQSTVFAFMG